MLLLSSFFVAAEHTENLVYDLGTGGVLEYPSFGSKYLNEPVNEIPAFLKQKQYLLPTLLANILFFQWSGPSENQMYVK